MDSALETFFQYLEQKPPEVGSSFLVDLADAFANPQGLMYPGLGTGIMTAIDMFRRWHPEEVAPGYVFQGNVVRPLGPLFIGRESALNSTIGEIVLWRTWQAEFTSRFYLRNGGRPMWSFLPLPLPAVAVCPPTLAVLKRSVKRVERFPQRDPSRPERGFPLGKLLEEIQSAEGWEIIVQAEARLLDQPVPLLLTSMSLAHVLDIIALHLHAVWDWCDDQVVLTGHPRCSGRCPEVTRT